MFQLVIQQQPFFFKCSALGNDATGPLNTEMMMKMKADQAGDGHFKAFVFSVMEADVGAADEGICNFHGPLTLGTVTPRRSTFCLVCE